MTKNKSQQSVNILTDALDFSNLVINKDECCISGLVTVSRLLPIYKDFMKQIRGKDIEPTKGFLRYIKDIVNREILSRYRIYEEPSIAIESESEDAILVSVDAMIYPQITNLEFSLDTLEIEEFSDRDYDSYSTNIKKQAKIEQESNDLVAIGDKVTINCTFEDSTHEQDLIVNESLQENLRNALINKTNGDSFEYKFDMSSIREHIEQNPQYKEYKEFFKKNKNIVSTIEVKRVIKYREPNDDAELIDALKLKSQEELISKIRDAMEKELEQLNYTFCRSQILEQIKSKVSFDLPKKLVDNYESAALEKFNQMSQKANNLHEEFTKNCRARIVEKLIIYFCINELKVKMRISEEQIYQSIMKFYGAKLNSTEYRKLRSLIIINSYIKSLLNYKNSNDTNWKGSILKQKDLTDARNTINALLAKENSSDEIFFDI